MDFPERSLRLVSLSDPKVEDPLELMPTIYQAFPRYYDKLINSKPIQCLEKNKPIDAILKPTAVVLDVRRFFVPP